VGLGVRDGRAVLEALALVGEDGAEEIGLGALGEPGVRRQSDDPATERDQQ
jgi:hypothetical protein